MNQIIVHLYKDSGNLDTGFESNLSEYSKRLIFSSDENAPMKKLITIDGDIHWFLLKSDYNDWFDKNGRDKKIHIVEEQEKEINDLELFVGVFETENLAKQSYDEVNQSSDDEILDSYWDQDMGMVKMEDLAIFYMSKDKYNIWRLTHPNVEPKFY